jgi:hypothetical protein
VTVGPVPEQPRKRVEVVVFEDGEEVERQDLGAVGYIVLTAEGWGISSMQRWPSGTAQFTIKRAECMPGRWRRVDAEPTAEPTDAEVEAAAHVFYERDGGILGRLKAGEHVSAHVVVGKAWRTKAHAVLAAARAVSVNLEETD